MLSRKAFWLAGSIAGLIALAALFSGCSAQHYRKSADKQTYSIIQQLEQQLFGRTNLFSIDTPYSSRDPKSILPAEIIGSREVSNRFVINLDQALELAVKHSREYQTRKEQLYLSALTLTGVRYQFTPQLFANVTPQVTGSKGGPPNGSIGSQIGVNQLLKTGGRLSVTLANDLFRYFTLAPGGLFVGRDSTISLLSVNLTQPLMRGFGINDPSVEVLTQSERDVVYAIRSYSLYQQQFAVNTVKAYFDLVTQKDIVRNNYRDFTNRVETTKYLESRAVDRERRSSVDDARNAELGARTSYINSLASYLTALDSFKLRLGLPLSTDLFLDDRDLGELIQAGIAPVGIERTAAFRVCVDKQMEILNAIDEFEDSKRKVRVAADQLRADVNLVGSARLRSESENVNYANFDENTVDYTAGVQIKLPLDRLNERNVYRRTLVNFESQLRSLALTLDTYKDRIDRGLRTVEQNRLNYINGVESLKVAERRVENNVMLFEAGRATIRDVREAQDGLVKAQNDLATIYADYLAARLDLLLNIGVIDTHPEKFWLQDPLQTLLAPEQRGAPPLRMPDHEVVPPEKFLEPAL